MVAGPGHFVVVFWSRRNGADHDGYNAMAAQMVHLATEHAGYLGHTSVRQPDGEGITLSYWSSEAAIKDWRDHVDHRLAQARGRRDWYEEYRVEVAKITRSYQGNKTKGDI